MLVITHHQLPCASAECCFFCSSGLQVIPIKTIPFDGLAKPGCRVELGEYNMQGLDYYYTLQGWLKGVNMPHEGDPGEDGVDGFRTGTDAFAFALGYYEGDFKPINPNATVSDTRDQLWERYRDTRDSVSAAGLYNGNISWMNTDLPGLGSNRMQAMVYGYDQLHRIVQARSLTEYGSAGFEERVDAARPYDVDYSYDANEDRALRIAPVEQFSEGPVCRGG